MATPLILLYPLYSFHYVIFVCVFIIVPGPVGNLKFKDVLDTSCRVMWEAPSSPNGGLTGIVVTIYL